MAMFIFQPSCFAFASHAAAIFLATSSDRPGRSSNAMAELARPENNIARPIETRVFFMVIPLERYVKREARWDRVLNSTTAELTRRLRKVSLCIGPSARGNGDKGRKPLQQCIHIAVGDDEFAMGGAQ